MTTTMETIGLALCGCVCLGWLGYWLTDLAVGLWQLRK